jgi:hypothetical protein
MLSITAPNAFHQDKDYPGNNSNLGCAQEGNFWPYWDYSFPKLPLDISPLGFGEFGQLPLEPVDHTTPLFPATTQLEYTESVKLELTRPLPHRFPSSFMIEPDI